MPAEPTGVDGALDDAVRQLEQLVSQVLEAVEEVAATVVRCRRQHPRPRAAVAVLERLVGKTLRLSGGLAWGLGFVPKPEIASDYGGLVWWQRSGPGGQPERLVVSLDPNSVEYYDYTSAPWFAEAARAGRWITGAYIDATGTNEHVVTLTCAVRDGEEFLGVAGADVLVSHLQRALQGPLGRVPAPVSLVDREGRVIATTDPGRIAGIVERPARGRRVRPAPPTPWRFVLHAGATG